MRVALLKIIYSQSEDSYSSPQVAAVIQASNYVEIPDVKIWGLRNVLPDGWALAVDETPRIEELLVKAADAEERAQRSAEKAEARRRAQKAKRAEVAKARKAKQLEKLKKELGIS